MIPESTSKVLKSSKNPSMHLWLPDVFGFKGGIQVYLYYLLKALEDLHPEIKYHIFLKNDANRNLNFPVLNNAKFEFAGNLSGFLRTVLFVTQTIGYALLERPDLIIVAHPNFAPVAVWAKRLTGVTYCVIVYGIDAWHIEKSAVKTGLQNADKILSISGYTRNRVLKEQNINPANILCLPCTFDTSRFKITGKSEYLLHRYGLKRDQPIILTVSRLAETEGYKGYDAILAALPKIKKTFPNIHYVLVGKGDDRSRIEKLITELRLEAHVTLTGFVPDEELCDHYNLCDVFAMPSKGEGFGIVYLEALACGKPTLGGNKDAAINALCQGELGALVNPDDIDEIAQTVIQILKGTYPNRLIYQAEALRQRIISYFGFEKFKETLAGYLESYLEIR